LLPFFPTSRSLSASMYAFVNIQIYIGFEIRV
jgi:hypothetical protein